MDLEYLYICFCFFSSRLYTSCVLASRVLQQFYEEAVLVTLPVCGTRSKSPSHFLTFLRRAERQNNLYSLAFQLFYRILRWGAKRLAANFRSNSLKTNYCSQRRLYRNGTFHYSIRTSDRRGAVTRGVWGTSFRLGAGTGRKNNPTYCVVVEGSHPSLKILAEQVWQSRISCALA